MCADWEARLTGPSAQRERLTGTVTMPFEVGLHDHCCLSYDSDAARAAMAGAWIADGLARGQRAIYAADLPADQLLDELCSVPDHRGAVEAGSLIATPIRALYDLRARIDVEAQLATYTAAIEQAVADGYLGLRVAVDITPLIADPVRRPEHLRWEQVADRYATEHPLAPLCLYDAREVQDLDAIVCAHPLRRATAARFALYGTGPACARLEGELDSSFDAMLLDLLEGLPPTDAELDLSGLTFSDGRSAITLAGELQRRRNMGQNLIATGATALVRRVWEVLDLDAALIIA